MCVRLHMKHHTTKLLMQSSEDFLAVFFLNKDPHIYLQHKAEKGTNEMKRLKAEWGPNSEFSLKFNKTR